MSDSDSDIDASALENASKRARKSHQNRALVAALIATTVSEPTSGPQGPKCADARSAPTVMRSTISEDSHVREGDLNFG